ncbi:MAG: phosphoribosyltransferase [Hyphomicrobiales bacterium]|nr:phosphoribosyltransferase [Hyphomicrobiales bacterium]MCP4998687.1 phosphoribosyltransferase [Hyphomicrobiales bacterium]
MFGIRRFASRQDAGRQLCSHLPDFDPPSTVVVALPRGGVPVGAVMAERFGLPLDVLLIRKIGVPGQPELALGAVSNGNDMQVTVNEDLVAVLGLTADDIQGLAERELPELERRRELYLGRHPSVSLTGKTVIIVDDGVATGATMRSAIKIVRKRNPDRIILALPVAPRSTLRQLQQQADEVVCLQQPDPFISVGYYYSDFGQIDDAMVVDLLRRGDSERELDGTGTGNK